MTKPPHPEEKYFGKIDVHKRRRLAEAKRKQLADEELERLKNLHWMRCAGCGMELEPIPFRGVTVLKCFHCGGVFLRGGTFEKLCGAEGHIIDSLMEIFKF